MMKATRINHKVAGWVSFKLEFDTTKIKKSLSKEELIQSIKRILEELKYE